jgi:hypothetical protein
MLLSTLPEIPGRTFEVRGLVMAHTTLRYAGGKGEKGIPEMVQRLIEQAHRLDADGIVDLSTVLSGTESWCHCVMTGTAVRLQAQV